MKSLTIDEQRTVTREECLRIIQSLEDTLSEFEKIIDYERDVKDKEISAAKRETIRQEERRFLGWLKDFLKEFAQMTPAQTKLLDNLKYSEAEIKSWLHSVFEGQKYRADILFKFSKRASQSELFSNEEYSMTRNRAANRRNFKKSKW